METNTINQEKAKATTIASVAVAVENIFHNPGHEHEHSFFSKNPYIKYNDDNSEKVQDLWQGRWKMKQRKYKSSLNKMGRWIWWKWPTKIKKL